jgi:hypothetical protein
MSNCTYSVDVRMTGECWIGTDMNGKSHNLWCIASTCLEGWRNTTKSLSLYMMFQVRFKPSTSKVPF